MNYTFYIKFDGNLLNVTKLGAFRIGRDKSRLETNKILIRDKAVSFTHCTVLVCDESQEQPFFWVWDGDGSTPSKNKTIVNGVRALNAASTVESEKGCKLYHGDYILLASHRVNFIVSREGCHSEKGTI